MDAGFRGYPRPDGRVGTRDHLLILSVTGLTGPAARRIAASLRGALVVGTPHGSGLLGADAAAQERCLAGLAAHPNTGAVLVVGGDAPLVSRIAEAAAAAGRPVEALTIDGCGHDLLALADRGIRAGLRLAKAIAGASRVEVGLDRLCLGLECGRSDPSSGLVANPVVGSVVDRVVDAGGTAILGETTEWLGAEHRLAARAVDASIGRAIREAAGRREAMAVAAGIDLTGTNPSATNIAAGLSSIEEKSLGAVAKAGSRPIRGLLDYGAAPPGPGLWVMDAPAYAPESVTGFTAAGANLVLFTTGVGNAYGSVLAPTVKISANPETCARLGDQLDLDLSGVFIGRERPERAADALFALARSVASGRRVTAEILGETDEVLARFGPAL